MIYIAFTILVVLVMFYIHYARKKDGIPEPLGWPYLRHFPLFWNKDHLDVYAAISQKYIKYGLYKLHILTVPEHIVLLDPDLPKHVLSSPNLFSRSDLLNKSAPFYANGLLMARGQHHEWQKKILSRAFTPQKLRDYSQIMDKHADILIKNWQSIISPTDGLNIEVQKYFKTLAFAIVAETILSYEASEDDCYFTVLCEKLFLSHGSKTAIMLSLFPFLKYLPFAAAAERKQAIKEAEKLVWKIISQRREEIENNTLSDKKKLDILSLMMEAREEGQAMTDEIIRDNVFTFMVGGFETTSTALSWTLYALSIYPDIQAKAREEVMSHITRGDEITVDHLSKVKYIENVLKEVLRVYNSSIRVGRVSLKDCELGGYPIRSGQMIKTVFNLFHMNEELFPQANEFRPERFEEEETIKKGLWLAFGYGPYKCIAQKFAMNEMKLVIAKILLHFQLEVDEDKRSFKRSIRISVTPSPAVMVRVKKLSTCNGH